MKPTCRLIADLRCTRGSFKLEVSLSENGRWLAVLGPSGCGKTTLLGCLSGTVQPAQGFIRLDGSSVYDSSSKLCLPACQRGTGLVTQSGDLFPHLSVRENLLFGRERATAATRDLQATLSFDEVVTLLEVEDLLDRSAAGLSGGERQRVALGRALLSAPRLLLLDEPLSALDAPRRQRLLGYLSDIKERYPVPCVYVTHSEHEALTLADRLIIMDRGQIVERGTPTEVLSSPLRAHPLRSLGAQVQNLLRAHVVEHQPTEGVTRLALEGGPGLTTSLDTTLQVGRPVRLAVRAEDVVLARGSPEVSARNQLRGVVSELCEVDGAVFVRVTCGASSQVWSRITLAALHSLRLTLAEEVLVLIKSPAIVVGPDA